MREERNIKKAQHAVKKVRKEETDRGGRKRKLGEKRRKEKKKLPACTKEGRE